MELNFYKIHLCTNDFILFNFLEKELPSSEIRPVISRAIARRTEGVGANGVIFLSSIPGKGAMLHHYNYAGMEELSYDAFLCASKFMFDYGIQGSSGISFATGESLIKAESIDSLTFRISPGVPAVDIHKKIEINRKQYPYTSVEFNKSGAAFFFVNAGREEKEDIARAFGISGNTSQHMRTVFTTVYANDEIEIEPVVKRAEKDIVFAAAVAGTASVSNSFCDTEIVVNCNRGELFFQWEGKGKKAYISGKPEYVFKGNYYFDEPDF